VTPSRYHGRFEGLPSPAAASMVATATWFAQFLESRFGDFWFPASGVAFGVALLGLLMVSRIPYRSFKQIDLRHSYGTLVMLAVLLPLVAIEPMVTLFFVVLAYVLSGPIEAIWRWRTGATLVLAEAPATFEPGAREAVHEPH
jgi:CDP-diacylglycerol--serine O-phosphatidyltransferase